MCIRDRDLLAGTAVLASADSNGSAGPWGAYVPTISSDGRFITFDTASSLVSSDTGFNDVYMRDMQAGSTIRVSELPGGVQPNGDSVAGSISIDGRWTVFLSYATNLVAPDANGLAWDVFVWDRASGAITLQDLSSTGVQGCLLYTSD